jgi:iron complex outermembrane recepter protein
MIKLYGANASPFVRKAMAALLLVIALALLPGAALSEAAPDDAGNAGDADAPGEVEATTDANIWDASSEADPNLIEAGTPAGEPPTPEHGGIEEMMVTAQKRSTNIQETPGAITALSGAQLFDRGIYDVESLATQIPNFQYGENFGIARITIRGIGNEGFTDPSTAFHIDGIYQNNQTAASSLTFYDIAQIEVLRGPQGTLWGRNSTAGAMNVSTRAPEHELEVFGDLLRGSYNQWSGRGVVNIPILTDRVAMRTAFYFDKRDGYQDNLFYEGNEQDADDADNWGIRPQVLFEITDEISLTMRGNYNHQGGVGWASKIEGPYPGRRSLSTERFDLYFDTYNSTLADGTLMQPNPSDPRQVRMDARQFQDIDSWDVNGTFEWDFYTAGLGDMSFTVVGSYRDEVRAQNFDVDLSEQDMMLSNVTASTRDRVIDAHLRSEGDTSTEWLLGFFMLDADSQINIDLPGDGGFSTIYAGQTGMICAPGAPPGSLFSCPALPFFGAIGDWQLSGSRSGGSNDTLSLAGYAHVRTKFYDDLFRVGLGLRYSYDRSRATRYNDTVALTSEGTLFPFQTVLFPPPGTCLRLGTETPDPPARYEEASWDAVTGDLKLEFLPSDEHMAYVSVSRGYKPGYINGDASRTNLYCDDPTAVYAMANASPESIWAYEIGSKNRFLDSTVQANFTAFLYQYDNLQILDRADSTTFVQNASKAQVRGIEFEGIWEPIDDLSLSVVYGYLNSKYLDYKGFDFATGQPADFSGNQMVRAPKHTATLAAEYLWDLGENGSVIPRIQYTVSDYIYFNAANSPDSREPAFGILQLRARWESLDDGIFIESFIENVTDEDVRSTRAVGPGLLGRPITVAYQPPRTWGIRVGASY